ncbi:hypothetical protein BJV78DRAFT_1166495 [Lactifluus subvellereus]|nr:hypothetical protein BJV78DRAFT_1166495 [Lactifluus subvellereus]
MKPTRQSRCYLRGWGTSSRTTVSASVLILHDIKCILKFIPETGPSVAVASAFANRSLVIY